MQIVTSRAGSAATAEYRVKNNSLSTSIEYGNNQSSLITDWLLLDGESTNDKYYHNDIIPDNEGGYLVAAEYKYVLSNSNSIISKQVDITGTVTSRTIVTIENTVSGFGSTGKPALVRMPDESVLCFVSFVESDNANLNAYRTTDNGESWTLIARSILSDEIDVSPPAEE